MWIAKSVMLLMVVVVTGCASKNVYNDLSPKALVSSIADSDRSVKQTSENHTSVKSTSVQPNNNAVPRIGIAFGGGGVRGFIHLGVIKALEEEGINASVVTGTSAGSIAAAFYASGKSYQDMIDAVNNLSAWGIADVRISNQGILQGEALADWVNEQLDSPQIESLPKQLGIAVTDLTDRQEKLISKGNVGKAVQVSSSIPGAFIPVEIDGNLYVDGGVLSVVPVNFARSMGADIVIAVDVYCGSNYKDISTASRLLYSAFRIQSCRIAESEMANADLLIQPDFEPSNFASFDSRDEAIEIGYQAAKGQLKALRSLLEKRAHHLRTAYENETSKPIGL
ncbi:patatin-like phospholipase family protein [Litoribrevibacter euphylliae]|uniref:Patatin-like phospholipase family protein n=1 Tax=Litoribrevibacter euphylliae TaxID=1834034 RepID=A0ABV7HB77_9GAMM